MSNDDSRPYADLHDDFQHWLHRASEVRAIAALLSNAEARHALERTAEMHDRMARRAEERLRQEDSYLP